MEKPARSRCAEKAFRTFIGEAAAEERDCEVAVLRTIQIRKQRELYRTYDIVRTTFLTKIHPRLHRKCRKTLDQ